MKVLSTASDRLVVTPRFRAHWWMMLPGSRQAVDQAVMRTGRVAWLYDLGMFSAAHAVVLGLAADVTELAEQLSHHRLFALLLSRRDHTHLHSVPTVAVQQQQHVLDAEVGEAQHAHALRHIVQHVVRHARPRCD